MQNPSHRLNLAQPECIHFVDDLKLPSHALTKLQNASEHKTASMMIMALEKREAYHHAVVICIWNTLSTSFRHKNRFPFLRGWQRQEKEKSLILCDSRLLHGFVTKTSESLRFVCLSWGDLKGNLWVRVETECEVYEIWGERTGEVEV
jgi:hypothetical protein